MAISHDIIGQARAVPIGELAAELALRRNGQEHVGPCPACGGYDRFRVTPRRGLFSCRGCGARGDVIALAMHMHGVDFPGAVEMLTGHRAPVLQRRHAPIQASPAPPDDDGQARADAIWRASVPIAGTAGAAYMASRGILLDGVPEHGGLRFLATCPYGRITAPCIVARFTDARTGAPRGIHRRAITAGIAPKTMTLGAMGGAVVRLWPDEDVTQGLVIGEGIETVLAAATRIQHRGTLLQPAWACCVAGNLEAFPVLPGIDALTILVDADENGRGQQAAERCAERWAIGGREITLLTPDQLGADLNDVVAP